MTQTMRSFEKEDVFKMEWLHSAEISPSGSHLVYSLSRYDEDSDSDYTNLYLTDLTSDQTQQLTSGKHNNTNPTWSPDGSTIAFLSSRSDKKNQIFLMPSGFGDAQQLTELDQGISGGLAWSPDGSLLAFIAGNKRDEPHDPNKPYRLTRSIYRFDAVGYVDRALSDVYVCRVADGEVTQLTQGNVVSSNPRWSPNGQEILYNAALQPDNFASVFPSLAIVDLEGNERVVLSSEQYGIAAASWLPDGKRLVFAGVQSGKLIGSKSDLHVFDIAGGTVDNRTPSLPMGVCGSLSGDMPAPLMFALSQLVVTDDGQAVFVEVQRGGTVEIGRVTLSGEESYETVVSGDRRCKLLGLSNRQREIFYASADINHPVNLFLSDSEGANERQVTSCNEAFMADIAQASVQRLTYPSIDGVEVESWLIAPDDGNAPHPTILYIHGGPHGAYGNHFRFDTQMLVGAGYAVLLVNHRASIGYDNAFSTAIKGDWGNLDYQDLMHGVDNAIAKGLTDADRLGVCGLSGGGNLSCWIVGQTDRFKAAVPENPVTNWLSFYGTSDIGVWFAVEELGGHPHEIPEIYAKCSPITYAHRCTTPTLLVQGENDYRCPAEQSEQFFTVLKVNGCVAEMLRLPNSPHGGSIRGAPIIRRAQNDALLDWMNRYVRDV